MTTPQQRREILDLEAKATPGEWVAVEAAEDCPLPAGVSIAVHTAKESYKKIGRICGINGQGDGHYESDVTDANAKLIAALRNSARELIERPTNGVAAFDQHGSLVIRIGACRVLQPVKILPIEQYEEMVAKLEFWQNRWAKDIPVYGNSKRLRSRKGKKR